MTQLPSASPPDALSPVPGGEGVRRLVAWVMILGVAAFMFGKTLRDSRRGIDQGGNSPDIRQMQILIVSRYSVGARGLISSMGQKSSQNASDVSRQMVSQLDPVARSPREQLEVAITVGEVLDGSSALKRVDALEPAAGDPGLQEDIQSLRQIYSGLGDSLTAPQRRGLIERYGWFGHLAAAYQKPAENADRKEASGPALRTFVILVLACAGILALLLIGFLLLIIGIVLFAMGKIRRAYEPARAPGLPFLEGFAIYLGGYFVIWLLFRVIVPSLAGHLIVYYAALLVQLALAVAWPLLRGVRPPAWRSALGWHAGRGALREMACGVVGYIAGLPLLAVAFFIVLRLAKFAGASPTHPIIHQLTGRGWQLVPVFYLAVVYAPIVEETLFRGAFFHALRVRHGWLLSASVTAFIFAAIHPQGWTTIPLLFSIALVFAAIREWRGTILSSATAHALNNGTVLLFAVMLLR